MPSYHEVVSFCSPTECGIIHTSQPHHWRTKGHPRSVDVLDPPQLAWLVHSAPGAALQGRLCSSPPDSKYIWLTKCCQSYLSHARFHVFKDSRISYQDPAPTNEIYRRQLKKHHLFSNCLTITHLFRRQYPFTEYSGVVSHEAVTATAPPLHPLWGTPAIYKLTILYW